MNSDWSFVKYIFIANKEWMFCWPCRFEIRQTRALKQYDEYLHAFTEYQGHQGNNGSTLRKKRTAWNLQNIMIASTSDRIEEGIAARMSSVIASNRIRGSVIDWKSWRGSGQGVLVAAERGDEALDAKDDPMNELERVILMTDSETEEEDKPVKQKRKRVRVEDTADNALDMDDLAGVEEVQVVRPRGGPARPRKPPKANRRKAKEATTPGMNLRCNFGAPITIRSYR